ncbi:MAG: phosphoglucosamine mutase, partial [Coriobacteriales bacterium]|nr:phosphoglucosamine mutase [Coriobacteriales bacterium]
MAYFGTDGVRGVANSELTCEIAFALGQAAVGILGERLVIGRDTRRSGTMLEAALSAGITSVGGEAHLAGIVPTPAVAYLTRTLGVDGGVVISASHNAPEYNGIKFFDAEGFK